MIKFEFFKLWFVLFYIYNHNVTFTLYINWTVFLHKYKYGCSELNDSCLTNENLLKSALSDIKIYASANKKASIH